MIGDRFWYTGIMLRKRDDQWQIKLHFYDSGIFNQEATEGEYRLRYLVDDPIQGVRTLKADADRMGLRVRGFPNGAIYYHKDGEGEGEDAPPENWRGICYEAAEAIGFGCPYGRFDTIEDLPTE